MTKLRISLSLLVLAGALVPAHASAAVCPNACGYEHPNFTGERNELSEDLGWQNLHGKWVDSFSSYRNNYKGRPVRFAVGRSGSGLHACLSPLAQRDGLWPTFNNNIESYRIGARGTRCGRYESSGGATGVRGKSAVAQAAVGFGVLVFAMLAAVAGIARWVRSAPSGRRGR